jgi:hypothetical protein
MAASGGGRRIGRRGGTLDSKKQESKEGRKESVDPIYGFRPHYLLLQRGTDLRDA